MSAPKNPPAKRPAAPPEAQSGPLPDLVKHRGMCSICRHPQLRQIDDDFLDWYSAREISRLYKLPGHATVSRHARATGLIHKRIKNLHFALGAIIEHVHEVKPNAAAIVSAIRLAVEINSEGEWVEPGDRVYLKTLFNRMTPEELGAYAQTGLLPAWFREAVGEDPGVPDPATGAAGLPAAVTPRGMEPGVSPE